MTAGAASAVELSVIVPCFNEEDNLPELVARTLRVFARRGIAGEIVLVNDGSRDRTGAVIDELARRHGAIVPVHHAVNAGIAAGWASGLHASHGRYVCIIDADLQYQPEAIGQLHREMQFSHADIVQGARSTLERPAYDHRYYMSRALDYLLKLTFGMPEHDVKSGFLLCKREVFEEILQEASTYYYFQHMITVVAKARGYSIRQVETLFEERRAGQSFIQGLPFKMILRTFSDVARGFVLLRMRDPKDPSFAAALGVQPRTPRRVVRWRDAALRGLGTGLRADVVRLSQNAPVYLDELHDTQWLKPAEIAELQLRRLRRLLAHAQDHVGYWREHLRSADLAPDQLSGLGDLGRLPITTRAVIRDNIYFDLVADNHDARQLNKVVTFEPDGDALGLFVDRRQLDLRWASMLRGLSWAGWQPGTGCLRLSFDGVRSGGRSGGPAPGSTTVLDPSVVDAATVDRLVALLREQPRALLEGSAEVLLLVARVLADRRSEPLPVGAIITRGQTLGLEGRALLERQFAGRVFDGLVLDEIGAVAQECPTHAGYHVHAERMIVELLVGTRPAAEGEVGELVVTDLTNRIVPLVRYRLPLRAMMTGVRCDCGRGLPLLRAVAGRAPAAVAGEGDRYIPAGFFAHLLGGYEYAIAGARVRQHRPGQIEVVVAPRSRFTPDTAQAIRRAVERVAGGGVEVRCDTLDALPPGAFCEGVAAAKRFPAGDGDPTPLGHPGERAAPAQNSV